MWPKGSAAPCISPPAVWQTTDGPVTVFHRLSRGEVSKHRGEPVKKTRVWRRCFGNRSWPEPKPKHSTDLLLASVWLDCLDSSWHHTSERELEEFLPQRGTEGDETAVLLFITTHGLVHTRTLTQVYDPSSPASGSSATREPGSGPSSSLSSLSSFTDEAHFLLYLHRYRSLLRFVVLSWFRLTHTDPTGLRTLHDSLFSTWWQNVVVVFHMIGGRVNMWLRL